MFLSYGPKFNLQTEVEPFSNVELYNLMCGEFFYLSFKFVKYRSKVMYIVTSSNPLKRRVFRRIGVSFLLGPYVLNHHHCTHIILYHFTGWCILFYWLGMSWGMPTGSVQGTYMPQTVYDIFCSEQWVGLFGTLVSSSMGRCVPT